MIEALLDKYGYASGLTIRDNKVIDWPSGWPKQPSKKEILKICEEYTPSKEITLEETIDVLVEDMNQRRLNGQQLHQEADDLLGKILAKKKKEKNKE